MASWLRAGVIAALLVATPGVANAFCRTTTRALPANYNPVRGCFTEGLFLYWKNACVGYSIQQDGSTDVPIADAERIIGAAFDNWTGVACPGTTSLPGITVSNVGPAECSEVRYNPETANQNLIVFRDNGWPYSDPNNTLGLTTVTFNADTGEIFDADMEINSSGKNLSISESVPANGFDFASVITHEAGHFLGLAHATDNKSTMYASYKPGTTALRTLTDDDREGLCAIYPSAVQRVVSPTATQPATVEAGTCDTTPRHGLTTKCFVPKTETKSGCSVSMGSGSGSSSLLAGVGLLGLVLAGRRRGRRST